MFHRLCNHFWLEQNGTGVGSRTYNDPLTTPTSHLTVPGGGGDDSSGAMGVLGKRKSEKVCFFANFKEIYLDTKSVVYYP